MESVSSVPRAGEAWLQRGGNLQSSHFLLDQLVLSEGESTASRQRQG